MIKYCQINPIFFMYSLIPVTTCSMLYSHHILQWIYLTNKYCIIVEIIVH